jgi:4-hydroxy-tetrahydrodipicolinate synthase
MIKGSIPALVTPFKDGALDLVTLKKLVEWHIAQGSTGLVPVGTTGESPTLSHDEHREVIEVVVKTVAGRVPVIAGAGSNNTVEGIDLIRHAEKVGADAALGCDPLLQQTHPSGSDRALHRAA